MELYGGEKAVVPQVECEWSSLSPYLQEFIGEESDVELHDRFAELFTATQKACLTLGDALKIATDALDDIKDRIDDILTLIHARGSSEEGKGITIAIRRGILTFVLELVNKKPVNRFVTETPHYATFHRHIKYVADRLRCPEKFSGKERVSEQVRFSSESDEKKDRLVGNAGMQLQRHSNNFNFLALMSTEDEDEEMPKESSKLVIHNKKFDLAKELEREMKDLQPHSSDTREVKELKEGGASFCAGFAKRPWQTEAPIGPVMQEGLDQDGKQLPRKQPSTGKSDEQQPCKERPSKVRRIAAPDEDDEPLHKTESESEFQTEPQIGKEALDNDCESRGSEDRTPSAKTSRQSISPSPQMDIYFVTLNEQFDKIVACLRQQAEGGSENSPIYAFLSKFIIELHETSKLRDDAETEENTSQLQGDAETEEETSQLQGDAEDDMVTEESEAGSESEARREEEEGIQMDEEEGEAGGEQGGDKEEKLADLNPVMLQPHTRRFDLTDDDELEVKPNSVGTTVGGASVLANTSFLFQFFFNNRLREQFLMKAEFPMGNGDNMVQLALVPGSISKDCLYMLQYQQTILSKRKGYRKHRPKNSVIHPNFFSFQFTDDSFACISPVAYRYAIGQPGCTSQLNMDQIACENTTFYTRFTGLGEENNMLTESTSKIRFDDQMRGRPTCHARYSYLLDARQAHFYIHNTDHYSLMVLIRSDDPNDPSYFLHVDHKNHHHGVVYANNLNW